MALGRFLFPAFIAGFLGFLFMFLFTTPVTPAPEIPDSKLPRAKAGDTVVLELTGYYELDGKRYVWFSTQEERRSQLPSGPIPGQFQSQPVAVELIGNRPLVGALLGKRPGDIVALGPLPGSDFFGEWEGPKSLPREFATYPYSIRLDGDFELTPGQYFNASDYIGYWRSQGVELALNTEWACEGDLWDCRVTELDTTKNVLVYRRLVADNAKFSITNLLGGGVLTGDSSWQFTILNKGETFAVRLDPPVGTLFTLRSDVRGPYVEGTYRVTGLQSTALEVDYSSATPGDPRLVGLGTFFEIQIEAIQPPG